MAKITRVAMKITEAKLAKKRVPNLKRFLIRGYDTRHVAMKTAIDIPIQTTSDRSTLERNTDKHPKRTPASAPRERSLIFLFILMDTMPTPSPIGMKTNGLVERKNASIAASARASEKGHLQNNCYKIHGLALFCFR
jgi:hypothetical protein